MESGKGIEIEAESGESGRSSDLEAELCVDWVGHVYKGGGMRK